MATKGLTMTDEELLAEIKRLKSLVGEDTSDSDEDAAKLKKLDEAARKSWREHLEREKKRLEKLMDDSGPEDLTQADIDAEPLTFSEGRALEEKAIKSRLESQPRHGQKQQQAARDSTIIVASHPGAIMPQTATERIEAEFEKNKATITAMGVTKDEYIRSRKITLLQATGIDRDLYAMLTRP